LQELQRNLIDGKEIENAKKCKDSEKSTVKDCYEFIYEEIKEQAKKNQAGGDDEGGFCKSKCIVF
jgi:hypothetical protein